MEQKLYQSGQFPLYDELQEVMEIISGRLSHKPVKFAVFLPFFVIGC
jgi:hypothetical protein